MFRKAFGLTVVPLNIVNLSKTPVQTFVFDLSANRTLSPPAFRPLQVSLLTVEREREEGLLEERPPSPAHVKGEGGRACVRAEKQSGLRGDGSGRPTEAQLWQGLGGLRIPWVAVHLPRDSLMTGVTHQQWHLTPSLTVIIVTALEWSSGPSCPHSLPPFLQPPAVLLWRGTVWLGGRGCEGTCAHARPTSGGWCWRSSWQRAAAEQLPSCPGL